MHKRVYISGKISGDNPADVRAKFRKAEMEVANAGDVPVCPLYNDIHWNAPWEAHMRADITLLLTCDEVLALPDHIFSPGATLELYIAERLHIPIKHLEDYGNKIIC